MSFKNEVIFIAFLALVFYYFSKTDTYKSAVKPKTYVTAAEEKIICTETMKRMSAMGQSPQKFFYPSFGRTHDQPHRFCRPIRPKDRVVFKLYNQA